MTSEIYENVWDALADTEQEAANLKLRSSLLYEIRKVVQKMSLIRLRVYWIPEALANRRELFDEKAQLIGGRRHPHVQRNDLVHRNLTSVQNVHSLHKAQQSRLRTTNFIDSILSHRTGKGQLRDRQIDTLRESPRKKPEATADVPAELYNHRIPLPAPLHRLDELPPLLLRHEDRGDFHLQPAT